MPFPVCLKTHTHPANVQSASSSLMEGQATGESGLGSAGVCMQAACLYAYENFLPLQGRLRSQTS